MRQKVYLVDQLAEFLGQTSQGTYSSGKTWMVEKRRWKEMIREDWRRDQRKKWKRREEQRRREIKIVRVRGKEEKGNEVKQNKRK